MFTHKHAFINKLKRDDKMNALQKLSKFPKLHWIVDKQVEQIQIMKFTATQKIFSITVLRSIPFHSRHTHNGCEGENLPKIKFGCLTC